jgi:hypothetical protein
MREPDPKHKPKPTEAGRVIPEEIPEDVRAELDLEAKQNLGTPTAAMRAEPVPEDVLAEMDAQARARVVASADADSRPVDLDEDSER